MSINATLIGQMITFALLVWFTMKYVWPPLMQALEERKKKIADGLAAADKGKHEMELAEKRATTLLREAKDQAADLVSLAQKRANELVDESKQQAKVEGDRIKTAAQAEVEREIQKAKEGLRLQVAELAIAAAGQILQKEVDQDKHRDIIDNLAKELGQA
ncbi:F0F1 ATP synthase subunit B [Methylomagnum ishizawai]|uniref:ATP synthase subunit b n=1 Tax=Methylomagnum ishizawai TaxID=1760988 RepID=A0A1Y6CSL9_9GAMM|nr:F0F1 ATP synthase subunit B [Methylomagnum ishizawai]BBL72952.1 ATP synthase subunit b [Methylomagnum ishizawai]SMF93316.1 F-type H+-transporting ATPase subunit b [Methylomagnum ishizawai]